MLNISNVLVLLHLFVCGISAPFFCLRVSRSQWVCLSKSTFLPSQKSSDQWRRWFRGEHKNLLKVQVLRWSFRPSSASAASFSSSRCLAFCLSVCHSALRHFEMLLRMGLALRLQDVHQNLSIFVKCHGIPRVSLRSCCSLPWKLLGNKNLKVPFLLLDLRLF